MVKRFFTGVSLVLFFAASTAYTNVAEVDYIALIKESTAGVEDDIRESWAYTETTTSSEGIFVGLYDPRQPKGKRWTLESVDGRAPKEKETSKFLKEKMGLEEQEENDENSGPTSLVDDLKEVRLVEETDEFWLLGFTPKAEGEFKDIMNELDGRIKIDKTNRVLEYISVNSTKAFKPNFATRIYRFNMKLDFGRATEEGPLVVTSLDFDINLKTVGVIKVDETVSVTFSEYTFVGG